LFQVNLSDTQCVTMVTCANSCCVWRNTRSYFSQNHRILDFVFKTRTQISILNKNEIHKIFFVG